jgi:hypothetical protein
MRMIAVILALSATLAVQGWATTHIGYKGEHAPNKELAVITPTFLQADWGFGVASVRFLEVDGISLENSYPTVIETKLPPGEHCVAAEYDYSAGCHFGCLVNERDTRRLCFSAKANHRYRFIFHEHNDLMLAWIEDEATGEVLAGTRPP